MIESNHQILISHKNILYDIGDTLVSITEDFETYTKRAISNIFPFFKQENATEEEFVTQVYEIRTNMRKEAHRTLYEFSFEDFIHRIGDYYSIPQSEYKELELAYVSSELSITILKEGVHDVLKRGKLAGKRQFIATNNFSALHVKEILSRFELVDYFEKIYISGEMNVRKPSPSFIDNICEDSKLRKEETIIIGDKLNMDILAAKNSQISSCWITKKNNESDIDPTYSVRDLKQIKF